MTPYLLQDALVKEIKALFVDYQTLNASGEPAPLNVYPQSLPAKTEEDDSEHFPYVVVRIADGGTANEEVSATCKIGLIVGVYDESQDYQGYKIVLNILRRIEMHLFSKRIIDKCYRIEYPYDWTIFDEDVHPYYFGGAETNWTLPSVQQEIRLSGLSGFDPNDVLL